MKKGHPLLGCGCPWVFCSASLFDQKLCSYGLTNHHWLQNLYKTSVLVVQGFYSLLLTLKKFVLLFWCKLLALVSLLLYHKFIACGLDNRKENHYARRTSWLCNWTWLHSVWCFWYYLKVLWFWLISADVKHLVMWNIRCWCTSI